MGSRVHRLDVAEKVLGYGQYPDDVYVDGMCYGSAVRSQYARARVLSIDTSEAEALPGVVCVLTAEGHPRQGECGPSEKGSAHHDRHGRDHPLSGGRRRPWCVRRDRETLEEAKKLVKVEYEVLPAVHNPEEAAAPDAPLVFDEEESNVQAYKHVSRGDAEGAIRRSKYVLTRHFHTPWTEHAFLEPECCVALPLDNGGVKLSDHRPERPRPPMHECASMLGVDYEHCQVQNCAGGRRLRRQGGYVRAAPCRAAGLCWPGVPVKVKLTRQEIHPDPPQAPQLWTWTSPWAATKTASFRASRPAWSSDTGAYASLGGPVLERACTHAAGPYAYENFEIDGRAYYTNNPPAGAFRGFGVTQTCFCTETLLNQMADLVGITPWEIRYRNAIRPGQVLPNGQIVDDSTGLVETLEAIKPAYDEAVKNGDPVGIACAMKNAGVGVGIPDWGRCKLIVEDGREGAYLLRRLLHRAGAGHRAGTGGRSPIRGCTGTTSSTSAATPGSLRTPATPPAPARRWSPVRPPAGPAKSCRRRWRARPSMIWWGRSSTASIWPRRTPWGADVPNPVSHVAYGYATQMCILDRETGRVKKMVAAHDVGKAVNPLSCEGQIEGGVVMSLGYALTEQYPIDVNCKPTAKYGMLGLFRANQIPPEIQAIVVEKPGLNVAGGAIGIGEITSIPTAPAIADAYFRLDGQRRLTLPLENTPYARKK